LFASRKIRRCQTSRKLGEGQAMEPKGCAFFHRDCARQIVDRSARRAEKQNFCPWAKGIQELSGFLKTDRC
jgi:hypothetical protein